MHLPHEYEVAMIIRKKIYLAFLLIGCALPLRPLLTPAPVQLSALDICRVHLADCFVPAVSFDRMWP
jgi:hypothetical protein